MILILQRIVILLFGIFLTACGFKFQGSETMPPQLQNVYINSSQSPHSMIAPELITSLQSNAVRCVRNPQLADITINITQDKQSSSQVGSGASQETRKYQLSYTLQFTVLNAKGTVIYGPTAVTSSMIHYVYSGQVLGNNQEEGTLYRSLRHDIVQKVLFTLSSSEVKAALANSAK